MSELILMGQPVIDYLCSEECLNGNIRSVKKQKSHDTLDIVLNEAKVLYKNIGGCVTNTSIGLAKQGVQHFYYGSVGNDKEGEFFSKRISEYPKINNILDVHNERTGRIVTFLPEVDNNSERTSYYNHGCANKVSQGFFCSSNKVLYVSCFSLMDENAENYLEIFHDSKKNNSKIILDGGGISFLQGDFIQELTRYADGLLLNENEVNCLENKLNENRYRLSEDLFLVGKMGSNNTEFYIDGYREVIEVKSIEDYVNDLGAGDAFAAGFLYSLLKGYNYIDAVHKGNLYASNIVEKLECH